MQWNKTFGGTNGDSALDVLQTSDGGYALQEDKCPLALEIMTIGE